MSDPDPTPIEEWKPAKNGRQYVTISGPGGGNVFRVGDETIEEAKLRYLASVEAKRRAQREGTAGQPPKRGPGRPKGKGRKPDAPPKPREEVKRPGKTRPTQAQLAAAAELPLEVLGAFIGAQVLNCGYCGAAMRANAGKAAADIAKTTNPYLLNLLTWWHGLIASFAGGDGIAAYIAPPLIHHALPVDAANFVGPFFGVPARAPAPPRGRHEHGPRHAETSQQPQPMPGTPGTPPPGGGTPPPAAAPDPGADGRRARTRRPAGRGQPVAGDSADGGAPAATGRTSRA